GGSAPRDGCDPHAGVPRAWAGGAVREREGLLVSGGVQPVRHDGARALPLPRHAGAGAGARRGKVRPGARAAAAAALRTGEPYGGGGFTAAGPAGADSARRDTDRRTAADRELAARRRAIRHAAAGLYRG